MEITILNHTLCQHMLKGTCNLCFFKKLLCKLQIFLICKRLCIKIIRLLNHKHNLFWNFLSADSSQFLAIHKKYCFHIWISISVSICILKKNRCIISINRNANLTAVYARTLLWAKLRIMYNNLFYIRKRCCNLF